MKELLGLIRAVVGIMLIGYFGAILWNILVCITPLRIWYRPTPLTVGYWFTGFLFLLCCIGPVIGLIGMGTHGSSFANGGTVPTYVAILAIFLPAYLWGMRQETLQREGRPNAIDMPAPVRGNVRTREEAIAYLKSLSPEERQKWEALARKYRSIL